MGKGVRLFITKFQTELDKVKSTHTVYKLLWECFEKLFHLKAMKLTLVDPAIMWEVDIRNPIPNATDLYESNEIWQKPLTYAIYFPDKMMQVSI